MKKHVLIIGLVISLMVLGLYAFKPESNKNVGAVGDVKYSILPPDKFIAQNGKGWVLMDEKVQIIGSTLNTSFGIKEIPDARGMFIRGLNLGRKDGNEDPFQLEIGHERVAGEFQRDAFQNHTHSISHDVGAPSKDNLMDGYHELFCIAKIDSWRQNETWTSGSVNGGANYSNETRPKNIALYIYIKINE